MNMIYLNNDNFKDNNFNFNQVVLVFYASGGAMGVPGDIKIILSDGTIYNSNIDDIDVSLFFDCLYELIDKGKGIFDLKRNYDKWKIIFLGMQNYLIIKNEYFDMFNKLVNDNNISFNELFSNWFDISLKLINNINK